MRSPCIELRGIEIEARCYFLQVTTRRAASKCELLACWCIETIVTLTGEETFKRANMLALLWRLGLGLCDLCSFARK